MEGAWVLISHSFCLEIILDFNRIREVPASLLALPALKKLSLQHNFISVISEAAVVGSGKKLSTVDLTGNPLAFPPPAIAAKGWSTVKKWVPHNPSFCVYRLYHSASNGNVMYTDFNISSIRDTMVKSKDEDRDATYIKVEGVDEVERLATCTRNKLDQNQKFDQQAAPGLCRNPNPSGIHLKVIEHIYFSVFDGHCGQWVAQALTTNLYKKFAEANIFTEAVDYEPVLKKVFMDLDLVICKKLIEEKWNDGSTAVTVTFKSSGEMICAHVGDSRASGKVAKSDVEFTIDHDPGVNKAEKERVEKRGGTVSFHKGCYRINENLSVSRAFGDVNLKKGILEGEQTLVDADPDVSVRKPMTDVEWLIVASDGLWHLMDNKDVIKMAASYLTAEEACLNLFREIDTNTRSQLKGHDNTTIISVRLNHGVIPEEFRVHGQL